MITDLTQAISIMKKYTGVDETDSSWDDVYAALLEKSKIPNTYRPWICAAFQLWSMSSGADRAMLKTADGATWLTPDELMNTVRGLLTTQEAMDGDAVEIPASWRVEEMRYAEGMTLRVSRLCGCKEDRSRSFLGVGFVV